MSYRVESLLSARLFVVPQYADGLGDPAITDERNFGVECSPRTHLQNMAAPLLFIHGCNEPRAVAAETDFFTRHLNP
jgi:hypothetical protein